MVSVKRGRAQSQRLLGGDNNKRSESNDKLRLLSPDEKESFYNKTKKKGIFSVFGKKRHSDAGPPTAPATPEALNVTVVDTEYDPSKAYRFIDSKSDVSGLTDRDATVTPAPRKVGFDMNNEELPPRNETENSMAPASTRSVEGPGTTVASSTVAETKTENTADSDKHCGGDSLVHQTLGLFDDLCNAPKPASKKDRSTKDKGHAWETVASEEDEESTFYQPSQSLQSTMDDSSVDRTYSIPTATTTANNNSVEVGDMRKKAHTSPQQEHENFEVVLDTSLLKGPPKRRSLFSFSKREDDEEEEKEESDSCQPSTEEPRSPGRKSLVKRLFSARKIKEEVLEERKSIPPVPEKNASLVPSKSGTVPVTPPVENLTKTEESMAPSDDMSSEEPSDERSANEESVEQEFPGNLLLDRSAPQAEEPAKQAEEKEGKWNKMLSQLELAETAKKSKTDLESAPTESFEVKPKSETRSKSKTSKKKQARSISLGNLAKKLVKPMKSSKKKSKDDTELKNSEPPPPPPAPPAKAKKPKPQWKAVVDPNSGKTYYYHRKTRETTWIKPDELKEYEAEQSAPVATKLDEKTQSDVVEQKNGVLSRSVVLEDKTTDQVVVSDDRFKTPPRRNTTEGWASETPESPIVPPTVVKTDIPFGQQSLLDRVESEDVRVAEKFDATWEKRREIERLLTGLSPPDKASVDTLMKQYEGKEDVLLRQLRDKVESQPFDEPFLDEPADPAFALTLPGSSQKAISRTATYVSKASATTKSSTITDKTEKIKNTFRDQKAIETISENQSTTTSLSSHHGHDERNGSHGYMSERVPVPRERELMIEELTNSRVVAETFDTNGRVTRGRAIDFSDRDDGSYYGDNEVDTCTSDTVSALSENDGDFLSRKENFDHARRRALDDAIDREDWDLAAVLTDGIHAASSGGDAAENSNKIRYDFTRWGPNDLDTLIAKTDWYAVKAYIKHMQKKKKASLRAVEDDAGDSRSVDSRTAGSTAGSNTTGSIVKAPSRHADLVQDSSLTTKRVGSRSQLQHRELVSESSWTSDSSYESSDSDYS